MSRGQNRGEIDLVTGANTFGVVHGLIFKKPSSGLTASYEGGLSKRRGIALGKPFELDTIASGTHAFTASKDTYVYVNGADGVLTYTEVANGASKPTQSDIGADSLWLYKVVTDGSNVTSIQRLWEEAAHGEISSRLFKAGFATTTVGSVRIKAPFHGRIVAIRSTVTTALSATDAGTVTAAIEHDGVSTAVTGGVVTIAASSALDVQDDAVPTAAREFEFGDDIKLTSAKATTGGEAVVELVMEKLS